MASSCTTFLYIFGGVGASGGVVVGGRTKGMRAINRPSLALGTLLYSPFNTLYYIIYSLSST